MVERPFSVNMYYSSPIRLTKSNIEKLNFCHFSNVVCDGSRFWIYMDILEKRRQQIAVQRKTNTHSTPELALGA
jgi:hypothetical protein